MKGKVSLYGQKLLAGQVPTIEDWKTHLQDSHRAIPGLSSELARYRTSEGVPSHALLASCVRERHSAEVILDLGCGDGLLIEALLSVVPKSTRIIGLDFSEVEVARAHQALKGQSRVEILRADAQKIPLGDSGVDVVMSHLALMLMQPLEQVTSEIQRILKPGGALFAVVPDGTRGEGLFAEIQKLIRTFLISQNPLFGKHSPLDPRTSSNEGYRELFCQNGLTEFAVRPFDMKVEEKSGSELWSFFELQYYNSCLSQQDLLSLRRAGEALISTHSSSGVAALSVPLKIISVVKP